MTKPHISATLLSTALLAGAGQALAHGAHADIAAGSLLHLLTHNWPVLTVVAVGAAVYLGQRLLRD